MTEEILEYRYNMHNHYIAGKIGDQRINNEHGDYIIDIIALDSMKINLFWTLPQ
jgi:hypothetical protein